MQLLRQFLGLCLLPLLLVLHPLLAPLQLLAGPQLALQQGGVQAGVAQRLVVGRQLAGCLLLIYPLPEGILDVCSLGCLLLNALQHIWWQAGGHGQEAQVAIRSRQA